MKNQPVGGQKVKRSGGREKTSPREVAELWKSPPAKVGRSEGEVGRSGARSRVEKPASAIIRKSRRKTNPWEVAELWKSPPAKVGRSEGEVEGEVGSEGRSRGRGRELKNQPREGLQKCKVGGRS